jgi:hypothetical protein
LGRLQAKKISEIGVDAHFGAAAPLTCQSNDMWLCTVADPLVWQPSQCSWQLQHWLGLEHLGTPSLLLKCPVVAEPTCRRQQTQIAT